MHLYGYKIVYFDEYKNKSVTERGMLLAENFPDAMEQVIRMYGDNESEDINIYFIEEEVTVITEENICDIVKKWEVEDAHEALENNSKEKENTAAH